MKLTAAIALSFTLCITAVTAYCQDSVIPGKLIIEPPTLICLGYEWPIEGDLVIPTEQVPESMKKGMGQAARDRAAARKAHGLDSE